MHKPQTWLFRIVIVL